MGQLLQTCESSRNFPRHHPLLELLHVQEHLSSWIIVMADSTALNPPTQAALRKIWTVRAVPSPEGGGKKKKGKTSCQSLRIICWSNNTGCLVHKGWKKVGLINIWPHA